MRLWQNRLLPWLTDRLTRFADRFRSEVLADARGRVLEVGIGSGPSLPFYGPAVHELVGLEPNEGARRTLAARLRAFPPTFSVTIDEHSAVKLPFSDASFDTVVFQLVLCSIDDVASALAEARRVLRPDGVLLYVEHIRHTRPRTARLQDVLNPWWMKVSGGCRLNQDTPALIRDAGFVIEPIGEVEDRARPYFLSHVVWGKARPVLQ